MIPFIKMHGLGNDYVFLDALTHPGLVGLDFPRLARAVSDRRRGVGSDGLIVILPGGEMPGEAFDVRMRIFNADGSEAEMCGNGVRCVAKHAAERLGVGGGRVRVRVGMDRPRVLAIAVETDAAGVVRAATVDMGPPNFEGPSVPFEAARAAGVRRAGEAEEHLLQVDGAAFWAIAVSVGNPHAVVFLEASASGRAAEAARFGPALERHAAFPRRVNVHFVEVRSPDAAAVWTWERGAGATMACGTGACAVLAAGVRSGRLARRATLALPGGDLAVRWDAGGSIFKTGPAERSFDGVWPG